MGRRRLRTAPLLLGLALLAGAGGEAQRLKLAEFLTGVRPSGRRSRTVPGPRLLLFDEPTNYLDVAGVEWVENWFGSFHGAAIVVSHDRAFLRAGLRWIGEHPDRWLRLLPQKALRFLDPDQRYSDQEIEYVRDLYDGEIAYTDHELRRLFEALKKLDLWENTILVVTSDHGEEFFEHGGWIHDQSVYEELLRVPLMIRFPKAAHAGKTSDMFVQHHDLAAAILEMAQVEPPEPIDGVSFIDEEANEPTWLGLGQRVGLPGHDVHRNRPGPGILPDPEQNSCYPKAARAAGIPYDRMILSVLEAAVERLGMARGVTPMASGPASLRKPQPVRKGREAAAR